MQRIQNIARLTTGAVAAGCTVTVYDTSTANLSTIYADDLQTPTAKANPFVADSGGYWFFYAASGRYDVVLSGGGLVAPITQADIPAGLGDGGVVPSTFAALPADHAEHAGGLARVTDQQGGLWLRTGAGWAPVLDYGLKSFTAGGLPAAGTAGRLRRVTDSFQGLFLDDGAAWNSVLAYAFPSATKAGLPAAALAGRLRRVSDNVRGLWRDSGTAWFGMESEVANAVEFGAVRDGATNDLAAIQAAIDAVATAGGGTVVLPPGSYAIATPILVRDKVTLRGRGGVTILPTAGWAGDSMIRTYRRDDNTPANLDAIRVEQLTLQAPAAPAAGFSCLDLTGAANSVFLHLRLVGPGSGLNGSALRIADQNPTASSAKVCQNNILLGVYASNWKTFLTVAQAVAARADRNLLASFKADVVRSGVDVTNIAAGVARLVLLQGQLVGDSNAASSAIVRGGTALASQLTLLQVDASLFTSVADLPSETFSTTTLAIGASGTTAAAALAQSGTLAQNFIGSAYLKIIAGTGLSAGANAFSYTLPGIGTGVTFLAIPVSGIPTAPISLQCALSGGTLAVTVISASALVLPSDFVYRVIQVAP